MENMPDYSCGYHIMLVPAFVMTEKQIDEMVSILEVSIRESIMEKREKVLN